MLFNLCVCVRLPPAPTHPVMQILEVPDETFQVQLFLPGVQPSFVGNMWSRVLIVDDGDGGVADRGYFEKLYAQLDLGGGNVSDPLEGGYYGSGVALGGPAGQILLVGSPGLSPSGVAAVGRVR